MIKHALTSFLFFGLATTTQAEPRYAVQATFAGVGIGTATALNKKGQLAGYYEDAFGDDSGAITETGFLYSQGTVRAFDPDPTSYFKAVRPTGINDAGMVVGNCWRFPFLYQDGVVTDLRAASGGKLDGAVAINNRGQIAGGRRSGGGIAR